jgi:MFS transporter, ACS family, tartrate transporter
MIVGGRSSDARGERIWHVALPVLLAASGFTLASFTQSNLIILVALTCVVVGVSAAFGPFFTLPSSFLSGPAAAGGIPLINSVGNLGGFVGPYIIGALRERSGGYANAMAALAGGLVLAAFIVLALARAMTPHPMMVAAKVRRTG